MKVWITKYALTQGIYEAKVEISPVMPGMAIQPQGKIPTIYYHGEGEEWHRTYESAKARAEEMVRSKIKSLQKQITKLQGLKF